MQAGLVHTGLASPAWASTATPSCGHQSFTRLVLVPSTRVYTNELGDNASASTVASSFFGASSNGVRLLAACRRSGPNRVRQRDSSGVQEWCSFRRDAGRTGPSPTTRSSQRDNGIGWCRGPTLMIKDVSKDGRRQVGYGLVAEPFGHAPRLSRRSQSTLKTRTALQLQSSLGLTTGRWSDQSRKAPPLSWRPSTQSQTRWQLAW